MHIEFSLPVTFLREGKYFIAHTPALDISTSAETYEKAKERFSELVNIYFEELIEMGTLDEVLQDQGWQKTDQTWSAPVVVSSQNETIEIPLHMLEHATHHTNLQKKV